jgi:ribonuclease PH
MYHVIHLNGTYVNSGSIHNFRVNYLIWRLIREMKRSDGRTPQQLRPTTIQWDFAPQALASVLIECGETRVICAVSHESSVPRWKEAQGIPGGWVTAEYSMLPYSTPDRKKRDIAKGKIDGRSQEIQRLIGRSLRSVVDMEKLGPQSLWIDCDVLSADGGTRTASITGSCLALKLAVERLQKRELIGPNPIRQWVAATSVGIVNGRPLLDLYYPEDRDASVDMNVVMTSRGEFVEVQASGEEATFSPGTLDSLMGLATKGIRKLLSIQRQAWKSRPKR